MSLSSNIKDNDWTSVRQAIAKLSSIKFGPTSSPTFSGLVLNSELTVVPTPNSVLSIIGSYTDANLDYSGFCYVVGDYCYISGWGSDTLIILDVSDPTNPTKVGEVTDAVNLNGCECMVVVGNYAYCTPYQNSSITVVDVSDKSNPFVASTLKDTTYLNLVLSLEVSGHYLWCASYNTATERRITCVDMSDPLNLVVVGSLQDNTNLGQCTCVVPKGNYAFVIARSTDNFCSLDISDPTAPTLVQALNDSRFDRCSALDINGRYAYVSGSDADTLSVVDISDPSDMSIVGSITNSTILDNIYTIQVEGDYVYAASRDAARFVIIDVSDPTDPEIVTSIKDDTKLNQIDDIFIYGRYAYVTCANATAGRLSIIKLPGIESSLATIGNIHSHRINVSENAIFGKNITVADGITVGQRGIGSVGSVTSNNSFQAISSSPFLRLENNTSEDIEGGRESQLRFKGKQSGDEISTLAIIQASHDGTSDDEKGDLIFYTNDGSDSNAPTERLRIDSGGLSTFKGNLVIDIDGADTAGSLTIQTAGGTGADAFIKFICDEVEADTIWSIGADDTGNSFRIAESAALGTTDRIVINSGTGSIDLDSVSVNDQGTNCIRIGSGADNGDAGIRNFFAGYRAGYNNSYGGGGNSNGDDCVYIGAYSGYGATTDTDITGSENVAVGSYTLYDCTSGYENTCLGDEAGKHITSGHGNVAIGNDAMEGNGEDAITGSFNTMVGTDTGYVISTGSYNVCCGYQCGFRLTEGNYNVLCGYQAGYELSSLSNIVAIGYQALHEVTDNETGNIAIGYQAGYYVNQTAGTEGEDNIYIGDDAGKGAGLTNVSSYNIGIGKSSLTSITSGISNICSGANSGFAITSGDYNFCVGQESGYNLTEGNSNLFIGYQSGYRQTTSSSDFYIGYQAGYNANGSQTNNGYNLSIGYQTLYSDVGSYNVAIGYQAGYYNDTTGAGEQGDNNFYLGYQAGYGSSGPGTPNTGYSNVAIGYKALYDNQTGRELVAIGKQALENNTTGYNSVAIGKNALRLNTTARGNFAIGDSAGYYLTTGGNNTAIGRSALYQPRGDSNKNVALGYQALRGDGGYMASCIAIGSEAGWRNSGGVVNIFIGGRAGYYNTSGYQNTFIGGESGYYTQTGNQSVCIGYQTGGYGAGGTNTFNESTFIGTRAGYNVTAADSCIYLGYKAGYNQTTLDDILIIDNQDRGSAANEITNSLIYGVFNATPSSQSVIFNSDVNIRHHLTGIPDEITATSEGVAASIDTVNTEVTTNGDSDLDNVTLANGTSGQIKNIYCIVLADVGDTWKITPAIMVGGTQITFTGVGQGCTLVYADNEGWCVVANNGGTIT